MAKTIKVTPLEIEALLCGSAEWLYRNKTTKGAEAVEIRKALTRVQAKLLKLRVVK